MESREIEARVQEIKDLIEKLTKDLRDSGEHALLCIHQAPGSAVDVSPTAVLIDIGVMG